MKLVTAAQMQAIDHQTIAGGFVPALQLMENAGRHVAQEAVRMLGGVSGAHVEILCGKGNNGGDGFVIARELARHGALVHVHMTHAASELRGDAHTNFARLAESGASTSRLAEVVESDSGLAQQLSDADLCVDALLGTGAERPLHGRLAALVQLINRCSRLTLAVDMPTGIDATTGAVLGSAVRAHCTVTFGLPKLGLALHPGRAHAGRLIVADIGIPASIVNDTETPWLWVGADQARVLLPTLDPVAHKYARGTLVVIAGSRAYPGAAALAAEAAQRAGAGMVHLVSVESNRTILETRLREVIVHSVAETVDGTCGAEALATVTALLTRADAVALGPGLGTAPQTLAWVRELLAQLELPACVDADALRALPAPPHPAPRVLTPHLGELARLRGITTRPMTSERCDVAAQVAEARGAVVLAKGAPTFVVDPRGTRHVNSSGNVALATGGTGDVLTGVIGALLAQGLDAVDAAVLGAYLHGAAADRIVAAGSPRSLVAGDIAPVLKDVFRELEEP